MKKSVFRPEIERNRITTNWARVIQPVAELSEENIPKQTRARPVLILVVSLLTIFALIWSLAETQEGGMIIKDSSPRPSVIRSPVTTPTISTTASGCTLNDFTAEVGGEEMEDPAAHLPSFVRLKSSSNFGGLLILNFSCRSGSIFLNFNEEWETSSQGWRLKKISQLPDGQLGDQ